MVADHTLVGGYSASDSLLDKSFGWKQIRKTPKKKKSLLIDLGEVGNVVHEACDLMAEKLRGNAEFSHPIFPFWSVETRYLLLRLPQKNQQITHFFHDTPPWDISRRRPSDNAEGDTARGLGPRLGLVSKRMGNAQHRTTQIYRKIKFFLN